MNANHSQSFPPEVKREHFPTHSTRLVLPPSSRQQVGTLNISGLNTKRLPSSPSHGPSRLRWPLCHSLGAQAITCLEFCNTRFQLVPLPWGWTLLLHLLFLKKMKPAQAGRGVHRCLEAPAAETQRLPSWAVRHRIPPMSGLTGGETPLCE